MKFRRDLSNDDLNRLTTGMQLSRHADGHVFIQEGEIGTTVFLIVQGTVVATQQVLDRTIIQREPL